MKFLTQAFSTCFNAVFGNMVVKLGSWLTVEIGSISPKGAVSQGLYISTWAVILSTGSSLGFGIRPSAIVTPVECGGVGAGSGPHLEWGAATSQLCSLAAVPGTPGTPSTISDN